MTLKGIDISSYQKGLSLAKNKPGFVIIKATEGIGYTDEYCDGFVQIAIKNNIPFGFYHFARNNSAASEAKWFWQQTKGYHLKGIPVADIEAGQNATWVKTFCETYHSLSGVWPWVYSSASNLSKIYSATVAKNCGLWVAGYPTARTSYPSDTACPYNTKGWTLACWQFSSSLSFGGKKLDGDIFYGDANAWKKYANPSSTVTITSSTSTSSSASAASSSVVSGSDYQVARDVINGKYGTGASRKAALGSRYAAVQKCVNLLLKGTDTQLAKDVIAGKMGNGSTRKIILGSRYDAVQKVVNKLAG